MIFLYIKFTFLFIVSYTLDETFIKNVTYLGVNVLLKFTCWQIGVVIDKMYSVI